MPKPSSNAWYACARSIGPRSLRCKFSTSASSTRRRASAATIVTGTSDRPAVRAARQRRAPATIKKCPGLVGDGVTSSACRMPKRSMDSANACNASASNCRRGCWGLGAMRSSGTCRRSVTLCAARAAEVRLVTFQKCRARDPERPLCILEDYGVPTCLSIVGAAISRFLPSVSASRAGVHECSCCHAARGCFYHESEEVDTKIRRSRRRGVKCGERHGIPRTPTCCRLRPGRPWSHSGLWMSWAERRTDGGAPVVHKM